MRVGARQKGSLLSPAGLVALLALVVSLSGTAWAAATITGADIKNGTVTTRDIKNNNLMMRDLNGPLKRAIRQSGARAVVAVWGDTNGCYVIRKYSRGFKLTCVRNDVGDYELQTRAVVNLHHTAPVCSFFEGGGYNSIYSQQCTADISNGAVRVEISRHDDQSTSPRTLFDAVQSYPVIVSIP